MKHFRLAHMINKYGVMIRVKQREGTSGIDDEGNPVVIEPVYSELLAIVVPFSDEDLRMSEAGAIQASERKLYTQVPLDLTKVVNYKGREHTVQAWRDYDDLSDVFIYRMSRRDNR